MNLETRHIASPAHSTRMPIEALRIHGSARLHFGFTDPSGHLGRRFGSIGLAIEAPDYCVLFRRLQASQPGPVTGAEQFAAARLRRYVDEIITHFDYDLQVEIVVEKALVAHAGLGSGTQLAIAAGVATSQLAADAQDIYSIAAILDRGARSSIGAAAFDAGGFIVDGGRDSGSQLAPVIVRQNFPEQWAIILVSDSRHEGLSAGSESAAFEDLPAFSESASGEICSLLLLKVLPALKVRDLPHFAQGISRVQEITGDYFSTFQGGDRFTSARVSEALKWLAANGAGGVGQSSWGPTGYAFCENVHRAHDLVQRVQSLGQVEGLEFNVTRGKNCGANIVPVQ